jgi:hypothetical protein
VLSGTLVDAAPRAGCQVELTLRRDFSSFVARLCCFAQKSKATWRALDAKNGKRHPTADNATKVEYGCGEWQRPIAMRGF